MRLLLCVLYIVQVIQAAPTTDSSNGSETLSSVEQRTLWRIVSTCTVTLLACIYSAIHPNIPSPNDSSFHILWRRLWIMIVALVVPDMIVGWALRQWLCARHVTAQFQEYFSVHHPKEWSEINEYAEAPAVQHEDHAGPQAVVAHAEGYEGSHARAKPFKKRFKDSFKVDDSEQSEDYTWTLTHSFFALMGGFMLYVDGKPHLTLSPDRLLDLMRTGSIYGPTLTEKQICDRSKGNLISKGSILLQGSWFILQLLSRNIYHLEPTQLEVGILAFVVLNFITYTMWWYKPLDVECPHPVYWKSNEPKPEVYCYDVSENDDLPMALEVMIAAAADIMLKLFGIHAFSPRKLRVAIVDTIRHTTLKPWESNVLTFGGVAISTIFGGIHCTAWFYVFPTYQEQVLWRMSAVAIIIMPWAAFAVVFVLYTWRAEKKDSVKFKVLLLTCPAFYIVARIILFILMFTTLRNLPPDAYKMVSWSNLVPHL